MGECDLYFILEKMADFFGMQPSMSTIPACCCMHLTVAATRLVFSFHCFFYRIVFLIIFQGEFDVPPGMHGSDVC